MPISIRRCSGRRGPEGRHGCHRPRGRGALADEGALAKTSLRCFADRWGSAGELLTHGVWGSVSVVIFLALSGSEGGEMLAMSLELTQHQLEYNPTLSSVPIGESIGILVL